MEKKDKMTWYDVTYKQFKQLEPLLALDNDMDRLTGVAELLLGDEVTDLPLQDFVKEVKKLDFLKEPIPEKNPPKKLEVNGKKYKTVLMVRVKPDAIRCSADQQDYWVVNGTTDEIRPYRILYKQC